VRVDGSTGQVALGAIPKPPDGDGSVGDIEDEQQMKDGGCDERDEEEANRDGGRGAVHKHLSDADEELGIPWQSCQKRR